MDTNYRVKHCTIKLPETLLKKLTIQARSEGYSIQEVISLLVEKYVNEKKE